MTEKTQNFHNLASRIDSSAPSRIQVLKEWLVSFFGVKQIDERFFQKLQDVSRDVDNIISQNPTSK